MSLVIFLFSSLVGEFDGVTSIIFLCLSKPTHFYVLAKPFLEQKSLTVTHRRMLITYNSHIMWNPSPLLLYWVGLLVQETIYRRLRIG